MEVTAPGEQMRFEDFSLGSIRMDGVTHEHDVVIDRGEVQKRKKEPSKKFQETFGHMPLSMEEKIPWKCQHLVVGTGAYGKLPVMDEVKLEAKRRIGSTYTRAGSPETDWAFAKWPDKARAAQAIPAARACCRNCRL